MEKTSKTKLRPLNGYIVLEPAKADTMSAGGIFLPETSKQEKEEGMVIETCDGAPVKIGDIVVYKKWSGDPFELDGNKYLLIQETDLIAIIEG